MPKRSPTFLFPVDALSEFYHHDWVVCAKTPLSGPKAVLDLCQPAEIGVLRPGGTLSSLGVTSTDLKIPLGAFAAGLGDHRIITPLCPGGKARMRRRMSVIEGGRVDLGAMVTHRFKLDDIEAACELFSRPIRQQSKVGACSSGVNSLPRPSVRRCIGAPAHAFLNLELLQSASRQRRGWRCSAGAKGDRFGAARR